jgi:hypothetical protein
MAQLRTRVFDAVMFEQEIQLVFDPSHAASIGRPQPGDGAREHEDHPADDRKVDKRQRCGEEHASSPLAFTGVSSDRC